MKTEKEYADELIDKYYKLIGYKIYSIKCATIDVTNTIDALRNISFKSKIDLKRIEYYQAVLQILKDKL